MERPFFILATQNPIEQAGTFPLPEAQLDRFLLYIKIDYPTAEEEASILMNTTGSKKNKIESVINGDEIIRAQAMVREVHISSELVQFVSEVVRATRPNHTNVKFVKDWVRWGAGPRAGQAMILAAKARALLNGRFAVVLEDLHEIANAVLGHRILMNFRAEADGIAPSQVTEHLIKEIKPTAKI